MGCADGPEAYSLAMLADNVIRDRNSAIPVMVFGTDIAPAVIGEARAGTYNRNMLQNVKLSFIDRYFTIADSLFSVNGEIRNQVDFSAGNIIDPG